MEPAAIDTEGLTRSRLEVFILRVVSPLLFWVRLKNGDQALQELEEELAFRMSRKNAFLICYPNDITVHMDVAVKEGNGWRRGWVEKISRPSSMVRVRLGDHGWSIWRPMNEIYHLEDRFRELSWQAFACGLAYTGSPTNATMWPEKTRELCRLLAEGRTGWINIVLPLGQGAALVKLIIQGEHNGGNYNFRDMLIKLGHVELSTKVTRDVFPAV